MTTPAAAPVTKPNPNALLLFWRKAHTWIGLFVGLFLVIVAVTGIYLNHKDTFNGLFGIKKPEKEKEARAELRANAGGTSAGGSVADLAALPVSFANALTAADRALVDFAVERVELKAEKGRWVYKVKAFDGREAVIDAHSAAVQTKGEMKAPKAEKEKKEDRGSLPGEPKPMDWGKAIKDLHTGKIGGDAGKLLVDLVAVLLVVLTLSGVYLWVVPTLRKRRSAQKRAAAATSPASPHFQRSLT